MWKIRGDRDYRYKYYDDAMEAAIGDITFILNQFEAINNSYFLGQLDKEAIAVMGHSFGGNVAHTIGFIDKHIKAVVDIDSKITERKIYGRIGVPPNQHGTPVLFIRGMMQYQEDVGDSLSKIRNAKIWAPNVQHSAFSDKPFLASNINGFGKESTFSQFQNWFLKKGPFFDAVDIDLGGKDVDPWYREFTSSIVTWLEMNLKQKGLKALLRK